MTDRDKRLSRAARSIVLSALMLAVAGVAAQDASGPARKAAGVPVTTRARDDLVRWVLAQASVAQSAPGHRLAAIRVAAASAADESGKTRTIVTAIVFDHTALEARRIAIDGSSGEILSNERLPGRPQRSDDEFTEGVRIVRRDAAFARLLDGGAVLDGGFIVDDPGGSRRRMIQFKLVSADRRTLLQTITVDLTRREIATAHVAAAAADRRPNGR